MVTLQEFIETLFPDVPEDERICLAQLVPTSDGKGSWIHYPATARRIEYLRHNPRPWYVCISSVAAPTDESDIRRRVVDCRYTYMMLLDDVGTKAKVPPVAPSYIMETSPGNFQYGYFLEPTNDFDLYDRTFDAIYEAGYTDGGAEGVHRVGRVPGSINIKPGRDSFAARVVDWHPERAWTLESLAAAMGVKVAPAKPKPQRAVGKLPEGSMLEQLEALGIVKESKGEGKHDLSCPWAHEHTDGNDGGACYWEPDEKFPSGTFNCFHEHCQRPYKRTIRDLKAWVAGRQQQRAEQRAEDARIGGGVVADLMPEQFTLEQVMDRFIWVANGDQVFDRDYPQRPVARFTFLGKLASCVMEVSAGMGKNGQAKTREVAVTDQWWKSPARPSADALTFVAGGDLTVATPQGVCVNTWSGWSWPDVEPGDPADFVKQVEWLFEDRAPLFLDWLAHAVQKPGELPHLAWIHISGRQGTGRGWLTSIIARVFAGYCAHGVNLPKLLESQFNSELSRKVIATVDEIREGGTDQWRHAEALKTLITEDTRTINAKHQAPVYEQNACRWLLCSNHLSAVPLHDGDRRFEVVINQKPPRPLAVYKALYAKRSDPAFIRGVAEFLLTRDISNFDAGVGATDSLHKRQLVGASEGPWVAEMRDLFRNHPYRFITGEALAATCEVVIDNKNGRSWNFALQEAGWVKIRPLRYKLGGKLKTVYRRMDDTDMDDDPDVNFVAQHLPTTEGGKVTPMTLV